MVVTPPFSFYLDFVVFRPFWVEITEHIFVTNSKEENSVKIFVDMTNIWSAFA